MKSSTKKRLIPVLKTISSILEKCGGQGGTPGPCPLGAPIPVHHAEGTGTGIIKDKHGIEYQIVHQIRKMKTNGEDNGEYKHIYHISTIGHNHERYGPNVGKVELTRKHDSVMWGGINHEFQRRGIATAAYKHIENHLGYKLKPNSAQTDEGQAFWSSRDK